MGTHKTSLSTFTVPGQAPGEDRSQPQRASTERWQRGGGAEDNREKAQGKGRCGLAGGGTPQGSFLTRKAGAGRAGGAVPPAAEARSEHRVAPAMECFLDTLLSPMCHFSNPDLGAQIDHAFLTAHNPMLTGFVWGGKSFHLLDSFTVPST